MNRKPIRLIPRKDYIFFKLIYGFKVKPWEIHPFERETSDIIVSAIQSKSSTFKIKLVFCSDNRVWW